MHPRIITTRGLKYAQTLPPDVLIRYYEEAVMRHISKWVKITHGLLALGLALAWPAQAGTVALDDGRKFEFETLEKSGQFYNLRAKGGTLQFPKSRVLSVDFSERAKSEHGEMPKNGILIISPTSKRVSVSGAVTARAPKPRADMRDPPGREIPVVYEKEDAAPPATRPAPVAVLPLPEDPAELAALRAAVDNLSAPPGSPERMAALQSLTRAGDAGLAALVERGLCHERPGVRALSTRMLGDLGGRRVLKHLIEAFYAAAAPTIPPYQVQHMRALSEQVSMLTGENFTFYARSGSRGPLVAARLVNWWGQNWEQAGPQLGEPLIDPGNPEGLARLKTLRKLKLLRRVFGGESLPPELAGPPVENSAADKQFARSFQTVPSDFSLDRNRSTSLAPVVPKNPSPARDAPGEFRRREHAGRLRGEFRARY
jgi:hypothetical protein